MGQCDGALFDDSLRSRGADGKFGWKGKICEQVLVGFEIDNVTVQLTKR